VFASFERNQIRGTFNVVCADALAEHTPDNLDLPIESGLFIAK